MLLLLANIMKNLFLKRIVKTISTTTATCSSTQPDAVAASEKRNQLSFCMDMQF